MILNEPLSVEERNSNGFLWSIQEQEDSIGSQKFGGSNSSANEKSTVLTLQKKKKKTLEKWKSLRQERGKQARRRG